VDHRVEGCVDGGGVLCVVDLERVVYTLLTLVAG
jgi:hypothetical protein